MRSPIGKDKLIYRVFNKVLEARGLTERLSVSQDRVVVSVTPRLGLLGWFALPAASAL
jgi:carboxylesterase type B